TRFQRSAAVLNLPDNWCRSSIRRFSTSTTATGPHRRRPASSPHWRRFWRLHSIYPVCRLGPTSPHPSPTVPTTATLSTAPTTVHPTTPATAPNPYPTVRLPLRLATKL